MSARYELQWRVATGVLLPRARGAALQCAALLRNVCTRQERLAAFTHALVLLERMVVALQGETPCADDLRACVLLATQLTVDEELALDAGLARALGMQGPLRAAQRRVMEVLEHRLFLSEREFVLYYHAVCTVQLE